MAVALLALFLTLGSGAYAAVRVNGRNIENRSIPAVKIKRNALTASEIQESTLRQSTAYVHVSGAVNANGTSQGSRRSFTSQRLGVGYYRLEFPEPTFTLVYALPTTDSAKVDQLQPGDEVNVLHVNGTPLGLGGGVLRGLPLGRPVGVVRPGQPPVAPIQPAG